METKENPKREQTVKQKLGQFFTTNYEYIFTNLNIPHSVTHIIEPFAGNKDLLQFVEKQRYNIELYDIDPKSNDIIKQDTLLNPPTYTNTFIITNPPYLARNKCNDNKNVFEKYHCNDLYKCFLKSILNENNTCVGGIVIIPLNFWCSVRKNDIDLRKMFLTMYQIEQLNIFEEQVFKDTSYTVCSFLFLKRVMQPWNSSFQCTIFPTKTLFKANIDENMAMIGGDIYDLEVSPQYTITRLTKNNYKNPGATNMYIKCIDDSYESQIEMRLVDDTDIFVDETKNLSARSYATLSITSIETGIGITKLQQQRLVRRFNEFLEKNRKLYYSLFLTNYRDTNTKNNITIARKRISFDLVYRIIGHLLLSE